jgi:hypothetical protein
MAVSFHVMNEWFDALGEQIRNSLFVGGMCLHSSFALVEILQLR